ncbi:N-acetylneuraminate synthase family protein [Rosistilla oblonga]|uniref:N-acetylneuraminate synthase family protein n=1 Tax=Rosistilla oblonga TaxID=2527990 RepID=UPI003A980104
MKSSHQDATPLFIFEMANNHQGSLNHGLAIVEEMAKVAERLNIHAAVKLQYRDLDTFIHPDFVAREDVKHIPRLLSTRLSWVEFKTLVQAIRDAGMMAIVTPFDEVSVDRCLDHGVDIIKVASCSANDWPLLEAIAAAGKPVICSTGGCRLADIDKIVSFFEHRRVQDLSLLHCVGIYPTDDMDQQLSFMQKMLRRYPMCRVGFSGHERPDNHGPGRAAIAMGAKILERHVGLPTETIQLNAYSMSPEQTDAWVRAVLQIAQITGEEIEEKTISDAENASLLSLKRGVFAKRPITAGEPLQLESVFFAMPCEEGQMASCDWQDGLVASRKYAVNERIFERRPFNETQIARSVVHEAKGFLREAGISLGSEYQIELSHHYGIQSFRRFGAILIDFFNREYCKKIIVLLPGQEHPIHAHEKKEETFQILHGEMHLNLNGQASTLKPGEFTLVRRGDKHSFSTTTGVIFEEISTTHIKGDSYYDDPKIAALDPIKRKTVIQTW